MENGLEGSPSKIPRGGAGGVGNAGMAVEDLVQENARLTEQNRVLRMALKRSEGGEGDKAAGSGSGPAEGQEKQTQSTYRVKKRLPGNKKNMNEIYSSGIGSVGRKSPQRGGGAQSEP